MTDADVLAREHSELRADLQELKQCQIRYFVLSVTGTGAVLGFARLLNGEPSTPLVALAPLTIILPCWCIFFDKATTITRLVGYLRLLEERLHVECDPYYGYERALREYRRTEYERNERGRSLIRSQFWIINWLTFFGLTLFSLLLAYRDQGGTSDGLIAFRIALGLSSISLAFTLMTLWRVMFGAYTYDKNEKFWRIVFDD